MRYLTGVIVAALLVGGCGDGESKQAAAKPNRTQDRAAIATAVHDYLDAYLNGRGAEACASYINELRIADDKKARAAGVTGGCAEVMSKVGPAIVEQAPSGRRQELIDKSITGRVDVRFGGNDLALATLTLAGDDRPSAKRIELQRESGEWRISRLAVLEGVPWP